MRRHYFVSDNLDDLATIERELEAAGITTPQIHILSNDDAGVTLKQLNEVEAVLRKNVVRGTSMGAAVGLACAIAVLLLVDVAVQHEDTLRRVTRGHGSLEPVGEGKSTLGWVMAHSRSGRGSWNWRPDHLHRPGHAQRPGPIDPYTGHCMAGPV